MEESVNLLSDSADNFLDAPKTKVELAKIERPVDESNVCIQFFENSKENLHLVNTFSNLCLSRHQKTRSHRIALLVISPDPPKQRRLGFCEELTANNLVFLYCLNASTKCIVYRDYGLKTQREIKLEDLGKRPFRF